MLTLSDPSTYEPGYQDHEAWPPRFDIGEMVVWRPVLADLDSYEVEYLGRLGVLTAVIRDPRSGPTRGRKIPVSFHNLYPRVAACPN